MADPPDELLLGDNFWHMHDFFASIGRVTVAWAQLEWALDSSIGVIRDGLGGASIEAEAPRSLKRKIKYLRKCFRQIESLKALEPNLSSLLNEISAELENRHTYIHSHIIKISITDMTNATLRRYPNDGSFDKPFISNETSVTVMRHAKAASQLAVQAITFTEEFEAHLKHIYSINPDTNLS